MERQWYAVHTKRGREQQVSAVLAHRQVEAFLPRIPARPRPGQTEPRLEPLFGGYLFAHVAMGTSEWVVARSAPGIIQFLGAAGLPTPLPDELIASIRARTQGRQGQGWAPTFVQGERVQIQGGPFDGLEAVFDTGLSASGRVRVFLELVSRIVPVEVDVRLLSRATA